MAFSTGRRPSGVSPPMRKRCYGVFIVLLTFVFSIALANMTKYIYVKWNYRYTMWLTGSHMVASWFLAFLGIHVFDMVANRRVLSLKEQFTLIAPFSLLGAGSIACSNLALLYLFPSLHEMMQSTSAFWTLLCSIWLAGKRYNRAAYLSMVLVTLGGALCAAGEPSQLHTLGLALSVSTAILRALRAIIQAQLLKGQEPIDSMSLLLYAGPVNLALFAASSLTNEGLEPWFKVLEVPLRGQLFIILTACTAALFNLVTFLAVEYLGAVASMVVQNVKTPSIILISMLIFGNSCSLTQMLGFALAASGVFCYQKYGREVDYHIVSTTAGQKPDMVRVPSALDFHLKV